MFWLLCCLSLFLKGDNCRCQLSVTGQWSYLPRTFYMPLVLTCQNILRYLYPYVGLQPDLSIRHVYGEAYFDCGLKRFASQIRGLLSEKFAHPCSRSRRFHTFDIKLQLVTA